VDLYSALSWTPLRRSGMARVLKGYRSFTCTSCIHLLMEWTIPTFPFPPKLVLIYWPRNATPCNVTLTFIVVVSVILDLTQTRQQLVQKKY